MADSRITRRSLLRGAVASTVIGLGAATAPSVAAAGRGAQIVGSGRIGRSVEGKTIPSPSDFGFTADLVGGMFVCSMYGPETGGFRGCTLMTVEGIVTPNSFQLFRGTATFSGLVAIFVFPDVFTGGPYLNLGGVAFQVSVVLGGPGKASMVLHMPAVVDALGGDTGGIVEFGRIERRRVRT